MNNHPKRARTIFGRCVVALSIAWFTPGLIAQAPANEKTVLTFSSPVQIPGAVLQPGKYTFKLAPSDSNRNILQVFDEAEVKLITTTITVPKKRQDPKGDVVLTFGAAGSGEPPALQAFFYPGTVYGHEFVYPETQARDLAQRNRTLVLSHNVEGTNFDKATLRVFNDRGDATSYVAGVAGSGKEPDAKAPMIMADRQGEKVLLDALEENPSQYVGKTISVDGAVEKVLGPRLFTIDEPNWGDLDGEILVFMPTALAALVAENDKVTISGTMRPFVKTEMEREWGWLDPRPEIEAEFSVRPVLVADRLVGGNGDLALKLSADPAPVGTAGSTPHAEPSAGTTSSTGRMSAVGTVADVVAASERAVGRGVDLNNVTVAEIQKDGGFWVRDAQKNRAFVLPQDHRNFKVTAGERVSISGVLLEMPAAMRDRLNATKDDKADLYVFATSVRR